jgi:A/G-specific adenine glycosylase
MLQFQELITHWYHQNKRDLPWRNTNNPYFIWLSEIILQQTRVDQGLPYFEKFANHYPSVYELANAEEQNILNDWQGLGYYSRARNLHKTAKEIVTFYNGIFPKLAPLQVHLSGKDGEAVKVEHSP